MAATMATEGSQLLPTYRLMALIRQFEARSLELSREEFMPGSIHLCAGQEAVPAGVSQVLGPHDRVIATYRGHGWALACGVPTRELLAEVGQRRDGINGGRCGSALLNAPRYRLLGENSIVGAGVPIAAGVALAMRHRGDESICVVSIGDGAMNQGSVNEAMAFATTLDLPLVIVCENNGWAEMTPTRATRRGSDLVDRAAGFHIPARVVDGCDPTAVRDAAAWAFAEAREGRGPVFLECVTVRLWGHYNRDIEHYRPAADREAAAAQDPLPLLRARMLAAGTTVEEIAEIDVEVLTEIDDATRSVRAMPHPDPATARDHVAAHATPTAPRQSTSTDQPRTTLTYQRAINRALIAELESRDDVLVFGEDVGVAGGTFGVTRGLQKRFGVSRVFDTPISESAILGSAVGAALSGIRPVVEIMWGDFLLVALDQLVNQAANVRYLTRGELSAPLVVRLQQGATPGACAQHSQSLEAILAHIPGLKVGLPSTSADAYAMTRAAIADPDPCVLIEARELYQQSGEVELDAPPEAVGRSRIARHGNALTVISWGPMVHRALEAAEALARDGIEISVLDLRWLCPLDEEALLDAVQQGGGRVVVAHEANRTGGFGAEIVARIYESGHIAKPGQIVRVAAPDIRVPAATSLQGAVIPGAAAIERACRALVGAL